MNATTYPDYKGWTVRTGQQFATVGNSSTYLTWCYATSPTGQTTEKAISDDADAAYKATCERVDRIEEGRK